LGCFPFGTEFLQNGQLYPTSLVPIGEAAVGTFFVLRLTHLILSSRDRSVAVACLNLPFQVHAHMLRHSTGYKLAGDGHDTRSIQDYLGHKDIRHMVRYTELSQSRSGTFGEIDPIGNGPFLTRLAPFDFWGGPFWAAWS